MDSWIIVLLAAAAVVVTSNAVPLPGAQRPNVTSWPGSEVCTTGVIAKTDCMCSCPECIDGYQAKVCWSGEVCRRKLTSRRYVRYNNYVQEYIAECSEAPRPAPPPRAGPRLSVADGTWHGSAFCTTGYVANENCMCSCATCIPGRQTMVCWAGEVCLHNVVSKKNLHGRILEDYAAQCVGADQAW
ncbi:hypothetical protein AAVH_26858 [Aphelenchoides avenae]|nr:hypothetical protein AAVH_26858 [Aphelenchus avenae]